MARTMPRVAMLGAALPDAALAERLATLGFDTVLIDAAVGQHGDDATIAAVAEAVVTLRSAGLALWLDVDLDAIAFAHGEPGVRPRGARTPAGPPPDPRWPTPPAAEGDTLAQFGERLAAHARAGVQGFRCLAPQRLDTQRLNTLVASVPGTWTAWTPGLTPQQVDGLRDAGVSYVVSSLPWWDGAARWWEDEFARLRAVAPVLMPVLATEVPEALPRTLDLAARVGDGLIVDVRTDSVLGNVLASSDENTRRLSAALGLVRETLEGAGSAVDWTRAAHTRASATALLGTRTRDGAATRQLVLVNPDLQHARVVARRALARVLGDLQPIGEPASIEAPLDAGAVRCAILQRRLPPPTPLPRLPALRDALAAPRVAIEAVSSVVDDGRFAARRIVGDMLQVQATIFSDGHDRIAAQVSWCAPGSKRVDSAPMRALGNDRWCADVPLDRVGRLRFWVEAWRDPFATARSDMEKRRAADTLLALDIDEAVALVEQAQAPARSADHRAWRTLVAGLRDGDASQRVALLLAPDTATLLARIGPRPFLAKSAEYPVEVERTAAGFGAWYELFPRSLGGDAVEHGTFDDVIAQLPRIRAMGFDVLYMPPIHPIGAQHRKGRNNSLQAQPGEPGSPYAIGSEAGGHDALHPQLGDFDAFARLVAAAAAHGMEIALDFAIQCSPDHPWLRQHPEWFAHRADGSIRYAENPPKRYEDIVNVDFHAGADDTGLWTALRDVVLFWVSRGVRLFRVDNPHTKPFAFWEWMIADVRGREPDVVFLSEAFTRPGPMYRLAKLGFSQSYTYFTWRNTKAELTAYFEELDRAPVCEFFRPHLFVNTPDINPVFLQQSGRAGHRVRAVLAATLSGLWGVYAPFELCEATPLPGKEEYLDSEKYQRRDWDWHRPGNITDDLARLNAIRRANAALHTHRHVTFYNAFDDNILYFGKRAPGSDEIVLVAVNLDPHAAHGCDIEAPLWEFGLPDDGTLVVEDLWQGTTSTWHGKRQHVHLDPADRGFALWRIRPSTDTSP